MITFLGHAGFKFTVKDPSSGTEKILFIDPWLNSPVCPVNEKVQNKADLILVTHGHFDHCSDAPILSKLTGAPVITQFELSKYMEANNSSSTMTMNKGGTIDMGWVKVTMVSAEHSGGCPAEGFTGGSAVGFVIVFNDGSPTVYHAGDTNVFADMKTISELYEPKIALLPIGGHFTMAPREAAYALNQLLLSVEAVVPMHYGTFPLLKGTPQELSEYLENTFKKPGRLVIVKPLGYGENAALSDLLNP